jgi:hypothetical protein
VFVINRDNDFPKVIFRKAEATKSSIFRTSKPYNCSIGFLGRVSSSSGGTFGSESWNQSGNIGDIHHQE